MHILTPNQQLEIARRVHDTFDHPRRWHQGGWGLDDDGYTIEFDGDFHVVDNDDVHHPPAYRPAAPESPRCFCLGAAIRIHTGHVLRHDSSHSGQTTETMSEIYTRVGRIQTGGRKHDAANFEPHLNAIIDWNDTDDRSYEDLRELTGAVLRHLDARRW